MLRDAIVLLDHAVLAALVDARTPFLNVAMRSLTMLGDVRVVLVILCIVGVVLWVQKKRVSCAVLFITVLGSEGVVSLLKHIVERPRPAAALALVAETGSSFPSAHTMAAVCLYGFCTYLVVTRIKNRHRPVVATLGVLLILGIAFSRLYLGVHYLFDVLASLLMGSAFLTAAIAILKFYGKKKEHHR